ncbi:unnamed protein product [Ectocarpus sp. 4 AP-2014]
MTCIRVRHLPILNMHVIWNTCHHRNNNNHTLNPIGTTLGRPSLSPESCGLALSYSSTRPYLEQGVWRLSLPRSVDRFQDTRRPRRLYTESRESFASVAFSQHCDMIPAQSVFTPLYSPYTRL